MSGEWEGGTLLSYCNSTKRTLLRYKYLKRKRSPIAKKGCKISKQPPERNWYYEVANPKRLGDDVVIELPMVIDIHDPTDRANIVKSIQQMHRVKPGDTMQLDFSNVEKVISGGMLLFYAELRNICNVMPGIKVKVICPKNLKVLQVLKQIKLLDFTSTECDIIPSDDDVVYWRFSHGMQVDAQRIYNGVKSGVLPSEIAKKLQGGMNEAVTNVIHHGYKYRQRNLSTVKIDTESWWMFSQIKDDQLTVVICDLGIGIPESLPYSYGDVFRDIIKKGRLVLDDAAKIKLAVDERLSATQKPHRGRGLKTITGLAKVIPKSYVIIYSNKGAHISNCNAGKAKDGIVKYNDSINGTIISFSFPIEKGRGHEQGNSLINR